MMKYTIQIGRMLGKLGMALDHFRSLVDMFV